MLSQCGEIRGAALLFSQLYCRKYGVSSDRSIADGLALDALVVVLSDTLRMLATAGHADDANRLAGRAYAALRCEHPPQAQQINALMHRLAHITNATKEQKMETADPQLDVRPWAPAQRHGLIFDNYHRLTPGEGFVLVNDHDPKPLYYQLAAEHPGKFTWDYLEEGPEVWRVRIGRPA